LVDEKVSETAVSRENLTVAKLAYVMAEYWGDQRAEMKVLTVVESMDF
jgi:hypothetical protein